MKKVILLGELGDKYGEEWDMQASSLKEVIHCIKANEPSFERYLLDLYEAGAGLEIVVGTELVEDLEELVSPVTENTIYLSVTPGGANSGGAKILAGVALVAAGWFLFPMMGAAGGAAATGGASGGLFAGLGGAASAAGAGAAAGGGLSLGQFASYAAIGIGLNLASIGLQQILAPDPSVDEDDQVTNFSGPQTTVVGRPPVPVLLGRLYIPGLIISSGIASGARIYNGHVSSSIIQSGDYSLSSNKITNTTETRNTFDTQPSPTSEITPVPSYSGNSSEEANVLKQLNYIYNEPYDWDDYLQDVL